MRTLRTLLTGALVLAPAVALPTAGAGAATCSSAGGVSVVVDYRELGGSTITECVPDGGGKSASAILKAAGVALSFATRQPGFVCRVNGVPAADPCVNTSPSDAYWGLFWANGTTSTWNFSSSGIGGLTVPAGGSMGWAWQQDRASSGTVPPGVAAPLAPTPTSTPSTTEPPTPTPFTSPTTSPTTSPSTGGQPKPTKSPTTKPTPTKTATESPESLPTPDSSKDERPGSSSPNVSDTPTEAASVAPRAAEAPSDSGDSGTKKPSRTKRESPSSDARDGVGSEANESGLESPDESSAAAPPDDAPARVPGWLMAVVGALLALAIGASAVVGRRRRA